MAKPKKKWSKLTPRYKDKLSRLGVSPNTYNAGKVDSEVLKIAQGKSSLSILRAKQQGLSKIIPDFDKLDRADRARLSQAYSEGLISRREPLTGNRNRFGLPETERVYTPFRNDNRHPVEVEIGPDGAEHYFRTGADGKRRELTSYGHPMRSPGAMGSEMDFQDILDELGIELSEADRWTDERRSALEASSG